MDVDYIGVVINVGHGALIDEKEMVKLLVHGEIGGVGFDVFENEPHVPKELFQWIMLCYLPIAQLLLQNALMHWRS
ncbi:hypothetical protein Pint_26393 [Pistacia integerrima]|uniref:Uncharacterized protein n=1 Tax=Pistacia integerrima TaxID=434235 RepID=A0ACC0YJ45_9ROSI|nr:hypothetical protein Pint_26393 [Pistacia integerrima]